MQISYHLQTETVILEAENTKILYNILCYKIIYHAVSVSLQSA